MTNDISLNSVEALIAAVPALLGFTPSDSIVVLVLGKTSPPLRLTIRLDMPAPNNTAAVVSQLRTILAQHSADGIITVLVGSAKTTAKTTAEMTGGMTGGRPSLPHQPFVAELRQMTQLLDVAARTVWVDRIERGQTWRCYDDPHCTGVVPDPRSAPAAVAATTAGTVLYGSREELAAQIAADPQPVLDHRAALLRQQPPISADDATALVHDTIRHLSTDPTGERLSDTTIVQLAHALTCPAARDAAIALTLTDHAAAAERLWTLLTRATPGPQLTYPATLLSISALLRGDGALVNVALDTALAADPNNGLAGLLRRAVDAGISPTTVRRLLTDSLTS